MRSNQAEGLATCSLTTPYTSWCIFDNEAYHQGSGWAQASHVAQKCSTQTILRVYATPFGSEKVRIRSMCPIDINAIQKWRDKCALWLSLLDVLSVDNGVRDLDPDKCQCLTSINRCRGCAYGPAWCQVFCSWCEL